MGAGGFLINASSELQSFKSVRLSDPIINADLATQNKAISAERVAEQTLTHSVNVCYLSPFIITGVTGSELIGQNINSSSTTY